MKKLGLQRPNYSKELKAGILRKIIEGEMTAVAAISEYGVSRSSIYRWLDNYSKRQDSDILEKKETKPLSKRRNKEPDIKGLEQKIALLEKSLEAEKLRSSAYKKMIEIAERDYLIPIGKKSGTKQSKK